MAAAVDVPAQYSKACLRLTLNCILMYKTLPLRRPPISYLTQVTPIGQRVVVRVAAAETKTTGGIILPSEAQRKPTTGEFQKLVCFTFRGPANRRA